MEEGKGGEVEEDVVEGSYRPILPSEAPSTVPSVEKPDGTDEDPTGEEKSKDEDDLKGNLIGAISELLSPSAIPRGCINGGEGSVRMGFWG